MIKIVTLQCVFHSIRFKVNKDWGSAEPFFFVCVHNLLYLENLAFIRKIRLLKYCPCLI